MSDTMLQQHSNITFKIGHLIRAYRKGIHVITGFDDRKGMSSHGLVKYRTVIADNLSIVKAKTIHDCDISYCRLVFPATLIAEQKQQNEKYDAAIKLARQLTNV